MLNAGASEAIVGVVAVIILGASVVVQGAIKTCCMGIIVLRISVVAVIALDANIALAIEMACRFNPRSNTSACDTPNEYDLRCC